jgi:hypothetical protein
VSSGSAAEDPKAEAAAPKSKSSEANLFESPGSGKRKLSTKSNVADLFSALTGEPLKPQIWDEEHDSDKRKGKAKSAPATGKIAATKSDAATKSASSVVQKTLLSLDASGPAAGGGSVDFDPLSFFQQEKQQEEANATTKETYMPSIDAAAAAAEVVLAKQANMSAGRAQPPPMHSDVAAAAAAVAMTRTSIHSGGSLFGPALSKPSQRIVKIEVSLPEPGILIGAGSPLGGAASASSSSSSSFPAVPSTFCVCTTVEELSGGSSTLSSNDVQTVAVEGGVISRKHTAYRQLGDFKWLEEQLAYDLPGCIIRRLPSETVVRGFAYKGALTTEANSGRGSTSADPLADPTMDASSSGELCFVRARGNSVAGGGEETTLPVLANEWRLPVTALFASYLEDFRTHPEASQSSAFKLFCQTEGSLQQTALPTNQRTADERGVVGGVGGREGANGLSLGQRSSDSSSSTLHSGVGGAGRSGPSSAMPTSSAADGDNSATSAQSSAVASSSYGLGSMMTAFASASSNLIGASIDTVNDQLETIHAVSTAAWLGWEDDASIVTATGITAGLDQGRISSSGSGAVSGGGLGVGGAIITEAAVESQRECLRIQRTAAKLAVAVQGMRTSTAALRRQGRVMEHQWAAMQATATSIQQQRGRLFPPPEQERESKVKKMAVRREGGGVGGGAGVGGAAGAGAVSSVAAGAPAVEKQLHALRSITDCVKHALPMLAMAQPLSQVRRLQVCAATPCLENRLLLLSERVTSLKFACACRREQSVVVLVCRGETKAAETAMSAAREGVARDATVVAARRAVRDEEDGYKKAHSLALRHKQEVRNSCVVYAFRSHPDDTNQLYNNQILFNITNEPTKTGVNLPLPTCTPEHLESH